MGKKKKGGKKKKKGDGLRGPPPEEECQTPDRIHASGSALYARREQMELQRSAPSYIQVLYRKEQDAVIAREAAESAGKDKTKSKKKKKKKK